ncbi:hypothetical protein HY385_00990 [Candidatus Daviesbacteria bacterium]|nr:hypothetical protein [Candidatus Daviesbacteria bacterium]
MKKKYLVIILGITTLVILIWQLHLLDIHKINVEIQNAKCVDEQNLKLALGLSGKNILLIKSKEVNKKLIAKYPCLREVQIEPQSLNTVKVLATGRTALASVAPITTSTLTLDNQEATPSSSSALLNWSFPPFPINKTEIVDETGVIFGGDNTNLLTLFLPNQDLKIGQLVDLPGFDKIAIVLSKLPKLEILIVRAKVEEDNLLIDAEPKIAFSLEKDILRQLASLQLILQKAKIDKKPMEIIDLRFDKPVITYYGQR